MTVHKEANIAMNNADSAQVPNLTQKHDKLLPSSPKDPWLTTPQSIRRVFDQFPLIKYRENALPQRARIQRKETVLYIFTTSPNSSNTNLSCNPACLRWQAYLKFNNIPFSVRSSNNHASPSGALPFIIPSSQSGPPSIPIPSSRISRWASGQGAPEENMNTRQEAYSTLIEQNIRNAWLYHLYLDQSNFESVALPLYIATSSSNRFVNIALSYQLKHAARQELLKTYNIIDSEDLFAAAKIAFSALSSLLGGDRFFTKSDTPGLFDASVFAYTHLLLDDNLEWRSRGMQEMLEQYTNLLEHRDRLLKICLSE